MYIFEVDFLLKFERWLSLYREGKHGLLPKYSLADNINVMEENVSQACPDCP